MRATSLNSWIKIAAFTGFLVLPTLFCAAASGDTIRPSAAPLTHADKVFRALADAPPTKRDEAINAITSFLRTNDFVAFYYTHGPHPERKAVMSRAIPILIAALNCEINNKAWWILINIQGFCGAPERAVYEKWWTERGMKEFEPEQPETPKK